MKTVRIGNNHVSAVALGCMRMGGLDEHGVDAIMYAAMESGICYFDHADVTLTRAEWYAICRAAGHCLP